MKFFRSNNLSDKKDTFPIYNEKVNESEILLHVSLSILSYTFSDFNARQLNFQNLKLVPNRY